MNLLPGDSGRPGSPAREGVAKARFRIVWGVLVAGLVLAGIGLDIRSLNARLGRARAERDRLLVLRAERESQQERLLANRERLRQLRVEEARLARWDEERFVLPELLRVLSGAIPDGVVLEAVRRDGAGLRLTGYAGSAPVVARTLEALSESERMRELELLWVEQAGDPSGPAGQRFALAGPLRYASREPEPFERIELLPGNGETSR